jgi:hypothetical protein
MCIHCCGNFFTEPLPSNDRGIHIQTHTLTGGLLKYDTDRLRHHDIHTKFHKDEFRHSKVDWGKFTDSMATSYASFHFLYKQKCKCSFV